MNNIIDELNKLSDEELQEIYIKGENLYIPNSRASTAKRILDSRRSKNYLVNLPPLNVSEYFSSTIRSASASLSTLSSISQKLNSIAEDFSNFGVVSSQAFALLLENIESIQKIASTATWQGIANNTSASAILDVVSNIQRLDLKELEDKQPQDLIPKKLAQAITSVSKQKVDKIYNYPAYNYFFNLEVYLRTFITRYIILPEKQLASKIPQTLIDKWKEKRIVEESNPHIDNIKYDLVEYSDFTDLKTILEMKSTITLIKDVISESNLKTITSKLTELAPIRIKIAHSRALSKDEFDTLKMYSDKIKKILK